MREAIVNYVRWAIERFPYEEPILDTCAGWEPNFYQPLFPGKKYIQTRYDEISIHPGLRRYESSLPTRACAPRLFSILERVTKGGKGDNAV